MPPGGADGMRWRNCVIRNGGNEKHGAWHHLRRARRESGGAKKKNNREAENNGEKRISALKRKTSAANNGVPAKEKLQSKHWRISSRQQASAACAIGKINGGGLWRVATLARRLMAG